MSSFELSKKIKSDKPLDEKQIKEFIKQHLSKTCVFETVSDSADSLSIAGRVKETLFTPVVKFTASFSIKVDGDKARINSSGSSSPFWVFWILFVAGLFTAGILTIVGIGLFLLQRNRPRDTCASILNSIETEFGSL